jgi:hypothetical protein
MGQLLKQNVAASLVGVCGGGDSELESVFLPASRTLKSIFLNNKHAKN